MTTTTEASSLYDWLDYNFNIRTVHENEWAIEECPYCGGRWKSFINPTKGVVNCFKCGTGWGLVRWLTEQTGWTREQVAALLHTGEDLSSYSERAAQFGMPAADLDIERPPAWRPDFRLIGTTSDPRDQYAQQYLSGRGFGEPHTRTYKLAYSSEGRYTNRIIIPVFEDGEVVYFQGRTWAHGVTPKYLNPSITEGYRGKGEVVFNLDVAAQYDRLYICEGPLTAMSIGLNAVALFGTYLNERQRSLIVAKLRAREVIVVLDHGAEAACRKIVGEFTEFGTAGRKLGYVTMPDARDLNNHLVQGGLAQVCSVIERVTWSDGWSTAVPR